MGAKRKKVSGSRCEHCGQLNALNAHYCHQCGNALSNALSRHGSNKSTARGERHSYWKIIAVVATCLLIGFAVKFVLYPRAGVPEGLKTDNVSSLADDKIDRQVQLVASNFKCACGGCGELPLQECNCDMPRGALEEKAFIRLKLSEGLMIDQVIQTVEKEYGLRITG